MKRSAVLLFYKDPGIVQNGSFVKVGKFDERDRVVYPNDLEESLIVNASKMIDWIYQMYLKAKNGYEHDVRVEEYITISNRCILPEGWTVNTLMESHDSKPYNPDIANVFYRAGFIENWGQGIQKFCDECREIGAELLVYELIGTTLRIHFQALESALIDQPKTPI